MPLSRSLSPVRGLGNALVVLAGRFTGNDAGAPAGVVGRGLTVTRTGAGVYRVALPGKQTVDVYFGDAKVDSATDLRTNVNVDRANRTMDVTVRDSANAAFDLTPSDDCGLLLVVRNTSVA